MGYECTWYDALPNGWRKAFGKQLSKELKAALKKDGNLKSFRFTDIKEKWGLLDIHLNYYIYDLDEKIREIEKESEHICEICGSKENVKRIELHHWIYTRCHKCLEKEQERYNKLFHNE